MPAPDLSGGRFVDAVGSPVVISGAAEVCISAEEKSLTVACLVSYHTAVWCVSKKLFSKRLL